MPRSRAPPPSWGQRLSSLTVSAVDTIAAKTDETTDETDETIGAIGVELYVERWLLNSPPDEPVQR